MGGTDTVVRVEEDEVRSVVIENEEFKAYRDRVRRVLGDWRVDRVRVLTGRYADASPELERHVEDYGARVESHLRRMGLSI